MNTVDEKAPRPRQRRLAAVRPADSVANIAAKAELLRRLELLITRRLDGVMSGDFLGVRSGPGTEPAGAREFSPGDDARRIDWNLTARSLVPHVRTTEADRELEAWIVADRSASLDFGTAQREKRDVVLAAVAAFGFLIVRGGNRLGILICGGDDVARIEPAGSRTALLGALSRLYDTPRRPQGPAEHADLAATLRQFERVQRRRGQLIVISDFLDGSDWPAPLRRISLRHHVVAVQVIDPREFELPSVGMLALVDTETGQTMHVQTRSERLRERYAVAATERHDFIAARLRSAGAQHVVLSTGRDWLTDITRFVGQQRHAQRRVSRSPYGAVR